MKTPKIVLSTRPATAAVGVPRLILIICDTLRVNISRSNLPAERISLPGKYALCWHAGLPGEENVFTALVRDDSEWHQAEWFDNWSDLPAAIERLRGRHPDIVLPTQVGEVIDY